MHWNNILGWGSPVGIAILFAGIGIMWWGLGNLWRCRK